MKYGLNLILSSMLVFITSRANTRFLEISMITISVPGDIPNVNWGFFMHDSSYKMRQMAALARKVLPEPIEPVLLEKTPDRATVPSSRFVAIAKFSVSGTVMQ
jgi:hypothetical protein